MIKANGTVAKDIALYFIDLTTDRMTPSMVAKTTKQAKQLLESGYTKEEIIKTIDYIIDRKSDVYSLGYISVSINSVLAEIKKAEKIADAKKLKQTIQTSFANQVKEVTPNDDSTQRNREKSTRFGVKSRFGEKFNLDLFKE